MFRAVPLGEVALRPGELGVDLDVAVEGFLRRRHTTGFGSVVRSPGPLDPSSR
jgi:hypothetical protein